MLDDNLKLNPEGTEGRQFGINTLIWSYFPVANLEESEHSVVLKVVSLPLVGSELM